MRATRVFGGGGGKVAVAGATALALLVGGGAGCSEGGGGGGSGGRTADVPGVTPGNVPGTPTVAVSQLVKADSGGSLYLNDEVSLVIPPGSLARDTMMTIERIAQAPAGEADGLTGFGQAYRFLPAGTVFAQELPAIMTVRYDGGALAARSLDANRMQMYYFDEGLGRYLNVANQVDTTRNTITSRVEHFTVYMPVAQATVTAGNPAPFVALQNSVPFPIRAGAPIYVRYTARDQDPVNPTSGYTGGAIATVKLYYRKLQPAAGTWQVADMVKEPVVEPTYGTISEDTYGYRIPETFLTAADLGAGNDIEYCAQATDNLGAATPPLPPAPLPPCTPVRFDVTGVYQPGSLAVNAPTTLPITAGFSRTFRVRGADAAGLFPIVPAPAAISVSNDIGTVAVSPTNATITFLARKQSTGVLTVLQGLDSSSNAITVTNGSIAALEVLDTNGMPIAGTMPIAGRASYAFDARGVDAYGNFIHVSPVAWTAAAALGAIGAGTGVLMAANSPAIGVVTATAAGLSATASVNVIPRYRVTANVTGLVGTTTLVNNGGDAVMVPANGTFTFSTLLPDLAAFNVAASVQPVMGACHGGAGFITGADATVDVQCYQLRGGSVIGAPTTSSVAATLAGASPAGSSDGTGGLARFSSPTAVTTDGRNLYVADTNNNVVRKVVIATGTVTTLAGSGAAGAADGTGPAASFRAPQGITTDGTFLYVSDAGATIRKIRIATGAVTTLAGLAGALPGHADGVGAAARFWLPSGLACDGTNLYVADVGSYVIRKIVLATAAVSTLAGNAGIGAYLDGPGVSARFLQPRGLTGDGTYLYVADAGNLRIRRVDRVTGDVTTVAGSGARGHTDATGTNATFFTPYGVTSDGTSLYVTESDGNVSYIRRIDPASLAVTTVAGGTAGYADGSPPTFGDGGLGITSDGSKLFIADARNNAVRSYYCAGGCGGGSPPTPTLSSGCLLPGHCEQRWFLPFNLQFSASGGFPPYRFHTDSPLLYDVGLFTNNGSFAGPATNCFGCTFTFQVCVTDVVGGSSCGGAQLFSGL